MAGVVAGFMDCGSHLGQLTPECWQQLDNSSGRRLYSGAGKHVYQTFFAPPVYTGHFTHSGPVHLGGKRLSNPTCQLDI